MSVAFAAAADAWAALLVDGDRLQFLETHFDAAMAMAVALAQPQTQNSIDWSTVREQFQAEQDEQTLLALVFAIQEVIEVIVRENLTFVVDNVSVDDTGAAEPFSASQRDVAAQQDALVQKLPKRFRLAFIKALRSQWAALQAGASDQSLRLNRLKRMSWRVALPFVLLRIVTSDNQQRIVKVPMKQFHQLRYSTAKLLQEMNQVETHPIMRLTNLERSKSQNHSTVSDAAVAP